MDHLNISLEQVSETAALLRTLNQSMYDSLQQMKRYMNDTDSSWMSEAGETIRTRFNQFALRFESQKEDIDSYARFLDRTVTDYDTLETTLNANASGMQN
ncbi:MAG: pore-forming ESAT-6 family protein [Solobacterium sp.]|nr:pore-forming ESAT-6 family protein [Solobacterium sp.]MBQ6592993.1 pore-forming ESAT-6 family protein [Solobacterium sp.]MBR0478066.1 pore-forming ESAT-6 family protein [Solobacterium sp.]